MSLMMNRGDVFMKTKEARRLFVIEEASAGKITVREASERFGLSCQQIIRRTGRCPKEEVWGPPGALRGPEVTTVTSSFFTQREVRTAHGRKEQKICQQKIIF